MSERRVDPDLEQVLVDLEADPQAGLFLAEPRKLIRGLQDGSLLVRPSRTGLSSAQRELLEVHQHELAWLLREAWLREFFDHPGSIQASRRFSISSREDLRKRWNAKTEVMPDEIRRTPEAGLLRNLLQPTGEPSLPTRTGLVWASLIVENAAHARVYLGMDHLFSGQPRAGLGVLVGVAEGPSHRLLRAQAESYAGMAYMSLERPEKALSCYLQAYELAVADQEENRALEHLFNVLAISAMMQDEKSLSWASDRIRDLGVPSKAFVMDVARRMQSGEGFGKPLSEEDVRSFAIRMADELDPTSREFLHALL